MKRCLPLGRSRAPLTTSIALALGLFGAHAQAQSLFWDGSNTTPDADGGSGIWSTTDLNWDTAAFSGTDSAWIGAGAAVFGGTAGTVTLGEDLTGAAGKNAASLTFNTAGYRFDLNNFTLTVTGGVASTVSGNLFTLQNSGTAGTLILQGNNSSLNSAHTVSVDSGTLRLDYTSTARPIGTAGIIVNGGKLQMFGSGTVTGGNNPVTFNGASTLEVGKHTGSDAQTLTSPGGLTFAGGSAVTFNNLNGYRWASSGPVTLLGDATVNIAHNVSTGTQFNGGTALNGHTLTITGTNSGSFHFGSGTGATGDLISGTGSLVIDSSANTLVAIFGRNTFSGETVLKNGRLVVGENSNGAPGSFTSGALGTGNLRLEGGSFRSTSSRDTTLSNSVTIAGSVTLNDGTNNTKMIFDGPVTLSGGSHVLTTTGGSAGSTTFNGSIGDGGNGLGFTKAGANTLILNGANSYTGVTTITGGTLIAGNNSALGTGAASVDAFGGRLLLGDSVTIDRNITVQGAATLGANTAEGGAFTGNVTLNSGFTAQTGAGTLTFGGKITGFGDINKTDSGTLVLGNATNDFFGNLFVNGGALRVASNGAMGDAFNSLTLNSGATLDATAGFTMNRSVMLGGSAAINVPASSEVISTGEISGFGAVLTKSGTGTLTLNSATSNSYSGGTIISAGTVRLGSNEQLADSANVTVNAGATLNLDGRTETINELTVNDGFIVFGGGQLNATANTTAGDVILQEGSTNGAISIGRDLIYAAPEGAATVASLTLNNTTQGSHTVNVSNGSASTDLTITGVISETSGAGSLVKAGSGTLLLSGSSANTFTGTTTVNGGVLELAKTAGLGNGGGAIIGDGNTGTVDLILNGGTLKLGASNQIADTVSISLNEGAIFDIGAFDETIHELFLSGGALVGTGTLDTTVGDFFLLDGANRTADLTLTRKLFFAGSTTPATVSGKVILSAANPNHVININDTPAAVDTTISGVIENQTLPATITKRGEGTLVLSGANTFGGAGQTVTVEEGLISISTDANLGNAANTVTLDGGGLQTTANLTFSRAVLLGTNGGSLDVTGNTTLTLNTALTGSGDLTKTGAGTLVPTVAFAHTGAVNVNGGTLALNNLALLGTSSSLGLGGGRLSFNGSSELFVLPVNIAATGGGTIHVANSGTVLELAGPVTGGDSAVTALTLTGPGSVALNPGNTFTGSIVIDGGRLVIDGVGDAGAAAQADPTALGAPGSRTITLTNGGAFALRSLSWNTPNGTKKFVVGAGGGTLEVADGSTLTLDDNTGADAQLQVEAGSTLTKKGTGTLALGYASQGATGFSTSIFGNIAIQEGTVMVAHVHGLGDTAGTTTVASGATLDLRATNIGENVTISGTGLAEAGALITGSGTGSLNGAVTLAANASIGGAGSLTINGAIGDGGGGHGITKVGGGTTTLAGSNTYTGVTTMTAGTLNLGNTAADSTTVRGNILVEGGMVQLTQSHQIADTASVTVTGGNFSLGDKDEKFANLTITGGSGNNTGGAGNAGVVELTGALTVEGGAFAFNSAGVWTVGSASFGPGSTTLNGNNAARQSAFIVGPGGLTLSDRVINMRLGSGAGTLGSRIVLQGDVTVNAQSQESRFAADGTGNGTRFVDLDGGTRTFTVSDGSATNDFLISVDVINGGIIKKGSGRMTLTAGGNSYAGGTRIDEGILDVRAGALGTGDVTLNGGQLHAKASSSVTFANNVVVTADAVLNVNNAGSGSGNTLTFGNLTIGAHTLKTQGANNYNLTVGDVALSGNATFDVSPGSGTQNFTIAGTLSDGGNGFGFTKTGTQTLVLAGANSYSGATTINAGEVRAQTAGSLGTGNVQVNSGGTISFDPGFGGTMNVTNNVSGSGTIKASSGLVDLGNKIITGTTSAYTAGLSESYISGSFNEVDPNLATAVTLSPVQAQVNGANANGWADNRTYVYSGQFLVPAVDLDNNGSPDATTTISFAESIDDSALLLIDGTQVIRNTQHNVVTSTGGLSLAPGWHNIELRLGNGSSGGGATSAGGNGWTATFGFGYDPLGMGSVLATDHIKPEDDGSMNFFRTRVTTSVSVEGGATLSAGGFTDVGSVTLKDNASDPAVLTLVSHASATNSTTENFALLARHNATSLGTLNLGANNTVTVTQAFTIGTGAHLTIEGPGTITSSGRQDYGTGAKLTVNSGTLNLNGVNLGLDGVTDNGGRLTLTIGDQGTVNIGASQTVGTLNSIGFSGSLKINGSNTALTVNAGAFDHAISGDGSFVKGGTGTLILGGDSPNTWTGTTTVASGSLHMSKTPGVNAIPGDLTINNSADKGVKLLAPNQIPDTATVTRLSGSLDFAGQDETIANLFASGSAGANQAFFTAGSGVPAIANTVTITNTLRIEGNELGAEPLFTVNSNSNTTANRVEITGGTSQTAKGSIVIGGNAGPGVLAVGSGGLHISQMDLFSTAYNAIKLYQGPAGATLMLNGDVTFTGNANNDQPVGISSETPNTGSLRGRIDLGGGQRVFNIGDGAAAEDLFISANIRNGGLTKTGAGTLVLYGPANTYEGPTHINEGTLALSTSGSISGTIQGSADINVAPGAKFDVSGLALGFDVGATQRLSTRGEVIGNLTVRGTLEGTGTVLGMVTATSGAAVAPGLTNSSFGTLSTADFNLESGAKLSIQLGSKVAGAGYDQLNVSGFLSLAGELEGSLLNGYIPQINDLFFIALNDSDDAVFGTFAGLDDGSTVSFGGAEFKISYFADASANGGAGAFTGGNDIALLVTVPEPSSAMMLLGSAGLLGLRRFRRKQSK